MGSRITLDVILSWLERYRCHCHLREHLSQHYGPYLLRGQCTLLELCVSPPPTTCQSLVSFHISSSSLWKLYVGPSCDHYIYIFLQKLVK
jgi:hypothetical protein